MDPSEITAEQVRNELQALITKYPDRTGKVWLSEEMDETTCVYYVDKNGQPINTNIYPGTPVLTEPVCIVGRWVEDFHPEFKEHSLINRILLRNSSVSEWGKDNPFNPDALSILKNAQMAQDTAVDTWGDIDLDYDYDREYYNY